MDHSCVNGAGLKMLAEGVPDRINSSPIHLVGSSTVAVACGIGLTVTLMEKLSP